MAKKSVKIQNSKLSAVKNHKILFILGALVLLVVGLGVKNNLEARADKKKFEQARASLDKVYTDIVTNVGTPDNSQKDNYCSRPNQEFGQGPLSCTVRMDFAYKASDQNKAIDLAGKISDRLDRNPELYNKVKGAGVPDTLMTSNSESDSYEIAGIKCSVKYTYSAPGEVTANNESMTQKTLQVNIGCPDSAKTAYYPLQN